MDALSIVRVITGISRPALSTFWLDTGKTMLVTVVQCLLLDWAVLDPTRAGLFGVFFVTAGLFYCRCFTTVGDYRSDAVGAGVVEQDGRSGVAAKSPQRQEDIVGSYANLIK